MEHTIGIDEVGRGCWAGPLVAGAAILSSKITNHPLLCDSKKLSALQRQQVADWIDEHGMCGLGWVSAYEVDELGLTSAVRMAMKRALSDLQAKHSGLLIKQIIIDGHINFLDDIPRTKAIIRADDSVPAVSAASIMAKVARDTYMSTQHEEFTDFNFRSHVGYGTAAHHTSLAKHGPTRLHRLSYKPIQMLLPAMSPTQRGRLAEARACEYLRSKGYIVLIQNWRTSWCEIDIIAKKLHTIFFIEVKYRRSNNSGHGLDYITPAKLLQMKRAADSWLQQHNSNGDYVLSAIELSGPNIVVTDFIESIE